MVIVEGCDGSGKTTLVEQLCSDLRIDLTMGKRFIGKRDEIWKTARMDTYTALANAVRGESLYKVSVWDRIGTISDPIYARVLGRDAAFSQADSRIQLNIMKAINCPVIMCMIPLKVAQENMERSEQLTGVDVNFTHIYGQYEGATEYLASYLPNFHTYDYRVNGGYGKIVDVIKSYLVRRKDREWRF